MAYWLMKTEPGTYSIDDLEREGVGCWEGVRNFTARRNLMAMKAGELAFFYHSSVDPPGIAGICEIVTEAYPDHTQFDPQSTYFDPKSRPEKPRWYMPDVRFVRKFDRLIPLAELRATPGLENMALFTTRRLSVQPVTDTEWKIIMGLAG